MLRSLCFAALFLAIVSAEVPVSARGAGTRGNEAEPKPVLTWSRTASPLPFPTSQNIALVNTRVASPDGQHEIACSAVPVEERGQDGGWQIVQRPSCFLVGGGRRLSEISLAVGPEALWAPDSRAVAVTGSNGGAIGTYNVSIYRADRRGSQEISSAVRDDVARRFPPCVGRLAGCTRGERKQLRRNHSWVNVAAIRWEKGSEQLLLLAWVPPSAYFGANMGRYNGYVVDASTGAILKRYSKEQFERKFRKYCGDWGL